MSRILLADDSPQALRMAEHILSGDGLEVVSVSDGAVALRRLEDVKPDVFITDVYLPTKNGFDLARYIRAQPQHRHIGIIFAAGPADQLNEQDAKNAGADIILRKPFEASSLLGAVHELASRSAAAVQSDSPSALDRNSIRAAVTLALDAAMPTLIEELTERVLLAMTQRL
jgi:CheY-like chemotaxis protein